MKIIFIVILLSFGSNFYGQYLLPLESREEFLKKYENRNKFYLFGDGNLNLNEFDISKFSSKLTLYYAPNSRFITFVSMNKNVNDLINISDSVQLKNVIFYPNGSNLGFNIQLNYYLQFLNVNVNLDDKVRENNEQFALEVINKNVRTSLRHWPFISLEIQNRNINKLDTIYKFDMMHLTIGDAFSWSYYGAQNVRVNGSINFTRAWINRGFNDFKKFFNFTEIENSFWLLGAKFGIQLNALTFSFDMKKLLSNDHDDENLKGWFFETKASIGGDFLSF